MEDYGIIISIVGIILSVILWIIKPEFIMKLFRRQKITNFIKSKNLSNNFTIAVVDDELDSYPIHYIQNLGYSVKTFESVSFSQAEELSKHDLILLDVKGVVKEDLEEGGAKLIKIIKDIRPLVPIIAVSSGYFHTELNDYFKTCDDSIKKPIDEYKIREILGELKLKFFDENKIAELLNKDIESLQISNRKKNSISLMIINYLKNEIECHELKITLHKLATTKTEEILCKVSRLRDRLNHA
jgi:CheY-like chemotaxis protein